MPEAITSVPKGISTVTPVIVVRDAGDAVEFYIHAFGAKKLDLHHNVDGTLHLASIRIGDSIVFVEQDHLRNAARGPCAVRSPQVGGCLSAMLHLYVEDVDATWQRAIAAGATSAIDLADVFWGERSGQLLDPFGHRWSLASRTHNLTTSDVQTRLRTAHAASA